MKKSLETCFIHSSSIFFFINRPVFCFLSESKVKAKTFPILSLLISESSSPQLFHLFVQFSPYHGTTVVKVVVAAVGGVAAVAVVAPAFSAIA